MLELDSPLAGEMSAHIFFKHRYYGYDDALYAAIRLLSILSSGNQSLADLFDALPKFENTPELRFDCPEERKFKVIDEVCKRLSNDDTIKINNIDGVRVTNGDGWWLLRASNTQAILAARCESSSKEGLKRLKGELTEQMVLSGITPPSF
jgi:phosphomannomutase